MFKAHLTRLADGTYHFIWNAGGMIGNVFFAWSESKGLDIQRVFHSYGNKQIEMKLDELNETFYEEFLTALKEHSPHMVD